MRELGMSLGLYLRKAGPLFWIMTIGFVGGTGGLISDAVFHVGPVHMPVWAWTALLVVSAFVAPFMAFHNLRLGFAADLASAIADRDSLKHPPTIPGTVAHVKIQLDEFVRRGRTSEVRDDLQTCKDWMDQIRAYLGHSLIPEFARSFKQVGDTVLGGRYDRSNSQSVALSDSCSAWIDQKHNVITQHDLHPGFVLPSH